MKGGGRVWWREDYRGWRRRKEEAEGGEVLCDVLQAIENVRTNKEDKPWEDISIVSIRVLDQTPSAK